MRSRAIQWIVIGFAVFLATIIILADFQHMPIIFTKLYTFPHGDRIGHFILFGLMSLLLRIGFPAPRIQVLNRDVPVLSLLLAVLIVGEELSQIFIPVRTFSWGDLAASLAGWGLGLGIGCWVSRNHQ